MMAEVLAAPYSRSLLTAHYLLLTASGPVQHDQEEKRDLVSHWNIRQLALITAAAGAGGGGIRGVAGA